MPEKKLLNKIILVTGAGDGIGQAVAKCYAQHGATVILLGKTTKKLEKTYDQIELDDGTEAIIYPMHLLGASPQDYSELKQNIENTFGRLDGIVHNAGVFMGFTPLENYKLQNWYNTIQVNLNAPFLLTQALLPLLKKADSPCVLFTLPSCAEKPSAYMGAYSIAYAGIKNLMAIMAEEWEENTTIRINSIDPGEVDTAMRRKNYVGADFRNLVKPKDIAQHYIAPMGESTIKNQHIKAAKTTPII